MVGKFNSSFNEQGFYNYLPMLGKLNSSLTNKTFYNNLPMLGKLNSSFNEQVVLQLPSNVWKVKL